MMSNEKKGPGQDLNCSFCSKSQDEVQRLIAGPDVYICDECVQLCNDTMAQEAVSEEFDAGNLLSPQEIKDLLDEYVIGQVAAKIRSYKKPEPYKGKGIKFQGEELRKKAGKAAGEK